ncbi:hypothetical protein [Arthrobacter luteolus]|uniref:hypothetical protein n=1 Tax=Arthrobacter luteolus TaxID=98672 RepID=UPI0008374EB9|nr:hypothetical protein [Arthrobacter luteolus]
MTISDAAKNFDFNSWFGNAALPVESADVYTRGDLVGRINYLGRRIEEEHRVAAAGVEAEESLGDAPAAEGLTEEYTSLLQEFAESRVTVYLRALTKPERKAVRKAHDAAQKGIKEGDEGFVLRLVTASIIGLQAPGQAERTDVRMTLGQVQDLYTRIGEAQMAELYRAEETATNAAPRVSADFLPKPSGPAAGPES